MPLKQISTNVSILKLESKSWYLVQVGEYEKDKFDGRDGKKFSVYTAETFLSGKVEQGMPDESVLSKVAGGHAVGVNCYLPDIDALHKALDPEKLPEWTGRYYLLVHNGKVNVKGGRSYNDVTIFEVC